MIARTRRSTGQETPVLVRGRGLGRAFARGRSPLLIRWFVRLQTGGCTSQPAWTLQLNVLAVLFDAVFDPLLHVFRVVSVSCVVRSDWHDHLLAAGVVPVERVVTAVTDHPDWFGDRERVTRDAHRRHFWRLLTLGELGCNRDLCPVETIVQP